MATYAVIMADRDVEDAGPGLPRDIMEAPADRVPLTDRDGNVYTGRLVYHSDLYSDINRFVARALETGLLPDGTPVPERSLLIADLARRPHRPAPLKFLP